MSQIENEEEFDDEWQHPWVQQIPQSGQPPRLGWDQWYRREAELIRGLRGKRSDPNDPDQGMHILFSGPTQSGKTLLCRQVSRLHDWVVVFGTKPVDPSLREYIEEGYTRIETWPPRRKEMREQYDRWGYRADGNPRALRFVLWPKIKERKELVKFKQVYIDCMDDVFINGGWCLVMDEGLWLADTHALNLGPYMSQVAYGAASNGVSMHLLVQRPSNIPRVTWSSCSQALLFHMGVTDDISEMAALGTYNRPEVKDAIGRLRGHEFLDLPVRGDGEWCVSEVDLRSEYVRDATVP